MQSKLLDIDQITIDHSASKNQCPSILKQLKWKFPLFLPTNKHTSQQLDVSQSNAAAQMDAWRPEAIEAIRVM